MTMLVKLLSQKGHGGSNKEGNKERKKESVGMIILMREVFWTQWFVGRLGP